MRTFSRLVSSLFLSICVASPSLAYVDVYVGYYDNLSDYDPAAVPVPFDSDATTTLISSGNLSTPHDTGVIRLYNSTPDPVVIDAGLKVTTPNGPFQLWDSYLPFTLNPGQNLVLAETQNYNFDSSDYAYQSGFADPIVSGSVNGVPFSFTDTQRILYGHEDNAGQGYGGETTPYGFIGFADCVPEPATGSLASLGLVAWSLTRRRTVRG